MTVAALWVIGEWRGLTLGMLVGLVGVSAVAAASGLPQWRRPALTGPLAAAPFAWLLALGPGVPSIAWVRALVVAGIAVGAVAVSRTDAWLGTSGLTPVLYAVSAFGVFAAVPDTEEAAALFGASVPGALAGWPLGRALLGRAGAAGATALVVWVSAVGGRGRPPSIVGAVACLGLLATLPAGRWLANRWVGRLARGSDPAVPGPVFALAAHTAVVAVASRVAGISSELRVAVPTATGTTIAALLASVWAARHPREPSQVGNV
ncbi:MAG TPA: hypothetical protein VHK25_08630 [Acidimicrobiales bacterium]|jgi:hypothetical protein|nr:hypothetical protein [Acidimicrobiales bacterium]